MFYIWVLYAFSRRGEGNKNRKTMSVVNLVILDKKNFFNFSCVLNQGTCFSLAIFTISTILKRRAVNKINTKKKKLVKTLPFTLYYAEKKRTRHRQILETNL